MLQYVSSAPLKLNDPIEKEITNYFATQADDTESIDWWQQHKEVIYL